jgi:hypothetical protein
MFVKYIARGFDPLDEETVIEEFVIDYIHVKDTKEAQELLGSYGAMVRDMQWIDGPYSVRFEPIT